MVDWDQFEDAGHDFTLLSGHSMGSSTYYCECCGAVLITTSDEVVVFHVPFGSPSTQKKCHGVSPTEEGTFPMSVITGDTLRAKLKVLGEEEFGRWAGV